MRCAPCSRSLPDVTAPSVLLATPRLCLRRFVPADAVALADLDSDPLVMQHISGGRPTPRQRIEQEILPRWISHYAPASCIGYWAAESLPDGEFIGWIHLRPDRFTPEDMELGYRLLRRVWGRGLATEGAIALLDHAFRREGIEWISARTLAANQASRRVMEKCGLHLVDEFHYPEGTLPGWSSDARRAVRYRVRRDQWLRGR